MSPGPWGTSGPAQVAFGPRPTEKLNPISVDDGSVSTPALAFTPDPGTGLYRIGSSNVGLALGGAKELDVSTAGLRALHGLAVGTTTANTQMTQGLTVQQGAFDDEILSLKSTDVAHGVTLDTETDTYFFVKKFTAAAGGADVGAYGGATTSSLRFRAVQATGTTVHSTAAVGAIMLDVSGASGTTTATLGAAVNAVVIRDFGSAQFIFGNDGTSYENIGTSWVNFDNHLDLQVLTDLSVHLSNEDDPIKEKFGQFVQYNKDDLERMRLVEFSEDEQGNTGAFLNRSRLNMLLIGAIRQAYARIDALELKLLSLPSGGA